MNTDTGEIFRDLDEKALEQLKEEFGEEKLVELNEAILKQQNQLHKRKIGRNDPCPCGSGKKFKKCCYTGGGKGNLENIGRSKLTHALPLNTKVERHPDNWVPNSYDDKGRGQGIGVVCLPPFQLAENEVNVHWGNGVKCFENLDEIIVLGNKDEDDGK